MTDQGFRGRSIITGVVATILAASLPVRAFDAAESGDIIVENAADVWDAEGAEWPRWSAHDASSGIVVDYSAWTRFMHDYASPSSDWGALDFILIGGRAVGYLQDYLYALQKVPVSRLDRDEQLAYWLNLHNAAAILQTVVSLPLEEENVRAVVMGPRWREKVLEVEGEKLSLVDIERRIVMRQWKDPRVMYGLYMPSHGAPGLAAAPYAGGTVWKLLDGQARAFVNSPRALEIHGDQLHVSSLYFWDKAFLAGEQVVIEHLRTFAAPGLRAELERLDSVTAVYMNWRLNSFNSGFDPQQDRHHGS